MEREYSNKYDALVEILFDMSYDTPEDMIRRKLTEHNIKSFEDFMNVVCKEVCVNKKKGYFPEKIIGIISLEVALAKILNMDENLVSDYLTVKNIRSIEDFVDTVNKKASGILAYKCQ